MIAKSTVPLGRASKAQSDASPATAPMEGEHLFIADEGVVIAHNETPRVTPAWGSRSWYIKLFRATAFERISIIKSGVSAHVVKRMLSDLSIDQGAGLKTLSLSTASINKKAKLGQLLSSQESERVIGLAMLVGQLEAMIEESGNPEGFNATEWMSRWLNEPLPAFGGKRPVDLMDTMEGQSLVSSALAKMQSGAYA